MLEILINGVPTRRYEQVITEMADTGGVSKSQVSRETIEAGERLLEELAGRDFSKLDLLAIWIDGIQLGPYHVIRAVGVDSAGDKHVLGMREGATENTEVAKGPLEDLVARVDATRPRLFVIGAAGGGGAGGVGGDVADRAVRDVAGAEVARRGGIAERRT